jgi:hypothetical protein
MRLPLVYPQRLTPFATMARLNIHRSATEAVTVDTTP